MLELTTGLDQKELALSSREVREPSPSLETDPQQGRGLKTSSLSSPVCNIL